jgi:hypothetical protein
MHFSLTLRGDKQNQERALKGVMRVGLLAKGLLLRGDSDVKLIVICASWPTKTLLTRVHEILIQKLEVKINKVFFFMKRFSF